MPSWKSFSSKRPLDPQYDSELRFHVDKLTEDCIAAGMSPEEARCSMASRLRMLQP
jgi:hypothetical protein